VIPAAILGRYSRSLADIAFEKNIEDKVVEDLGVFSDVFSSVPDVLGTLDSPAVPRTSKEQLLDKLTAQYPIDPVSANFLRVLLEHNRIRYFNEILEKFTQMVKARKGVLDAGVITAEPLGQEDVTRIKKRLEKMTGKRVNVTPQTDADIIGGTVVRIGSKIYDGSIRTRLAEMKRRLAEV